MEVPSNTLETVYGSDGIGDEDSGRGMTDRVQTVATAIYRELKRLIPTYGEDVFKEMMPHVVSILESLDAAYKENEEKVSKSKHSVSKLCQWCCLFIYIYVYSEFCNL